MLAITWTRAVISCRVNCCRRPVFKKKSGFNITINRRRLASAADPATCEFYFLQHRHRRLADADSPMFQQAPMSPIFDVRCVHRPNSSCNFRYTQAVCRNVQVAGLQTAFACDDTIRCICRMMMALGFLPANVIRDVYDELSASIGQHTQTRY